MFSIWSFGRVFWFVWEMAPDWSTMCILYYTLCRWGSDTKKCGLCLWFVCVLFVFYVCKHANMYYICLHPQDDEFKTIQQRRKWSEFTIQRWGRSERFSITNVWTKPFLAPCLPRYATTVDWYLVWWIWYKCSFLDALASLELVITVTVTGSPEILSSGLLVKPVKLKPIPMIYLSLIHISEPTRPY